jgi:hypothetical protein
LYRVPLFAARNRTPHVRASDAVLLSLVVLNICPADERNLPNKAATAFSAGDAGETGGG